ncbi:MAG: hypothetical protein IPM61_16400 [Chlorobi bacterium]|nr:hypothetical protein [Chlorobiota bacterium]
MVALLIEVCRRLLLLINGLAIAERLTPCRDAAAHFRLRLAATLGSLLRRWRREFLSGWIVGGVGGAISLLAIGIVAVQPTERKRIF